MSETTPEPGLLAQRLDYPFRTVHPAGRGPYTYREAAETINKKAGRKIISPQYLLYLRKGLRLQPAHEKLITVADFFGVPWAYFDADSDHATRTEQDVRLLALLSDPEVRAIAEHAAGLSSTSLSAILTMIDAARQLEGLPSPGSAPAS